MAGEGGFELFPVDSPFSPRHEAQFNIEGKTFYCVLQYMLYRKADFFKDKEQAIDIMSTRDLKVIERCGKNVHKVDARIWNRERIKWAELALEEKFTQIPALKEQLFATFPRTLAYATTKDRFWSIGLSAENPKALSGKCFSDCNFYGDVLTKIRDKLMKIENRLQEDGQGQGKRVEAGRDERRQGVEGSSQRGEGQAGRGEKRQVGGGSRKKRFGRGNRHGVEGQQGRDGRRQGQAREERRQGGGGNSHGVEGQVGRYEGREDAERNSHGVEGETNWNERREDAERNSHGVEGQTNCFPFRMSLAMSRSTADMNPTNEKQSASPRAEESTRGATSLEEAKQKYKFFWKVQSPFSQWYPASFEVNDQKYNCAEQYMMHQKAVLFADEEIAAKVLKTQDPKQQKSLGRKVRNWDDKTWTDNCQRIVEEANEAKFSQNEGLKKQLFATYPKTLVEASPVDTIWGIGYAEDHVNAWDERSWRGTNYLGYALTRVREKLMKQDGLK